MLESLRDRIARHPVASFLLLAYAFTWSVQAVILATGMEASWTLSILAGFGGFGPPVAAAIVVAASGGSLRTWLSQFLRWRVGARWWAVALGLPLLILATGSALFVLGGGPVDLGALPFVGVYLFVMVWGTLWGGGQEELGWRGFMLPLLQERYSALASSLAVGAAWTLWHLPLLLNANTVHGGWSPTQQAIWMTTIFSGSVLWTWMYNSTRGSVLLVAVFHAGVNSMGVFHPADLDALAPGGVPDPRLNLLAEVTGALPLVAAAIAVLAIFGARRLSHHDDVPGREVVGLDDESEAAGRDDGPE